MLFIIDQSLKEMGGHHFDYTRLIADAAVRLGIEPVIATHRDLRNDALQELSQYGRVEKAFRESTYTWLSHLAGLKELVANDRFGKRNLKRRLDATKGRVHNFLARRAQDKRVQLRSRLISLFAEDCESFFSEFSLDESDHVFFTTMSELEFMGLTAFLGNHSDSVQATWHTQFHFSMFSGRPDEFASQGRQERLLKGAFQSALARAPYHEIHAYTTSDELTAQYNRMKVLSFDSLPYPVNPDLLYDHKYDRNYESSRKRTGPLRMTVAGGVRREKGQKTVVHNLINSIWDSQIASGNVRIDIQAGKPGSFGCRRVMKGRSVDKKQYQNSVRVHPHPLPESDYVDLVQNSDIGLFCYDSRRYYSRRAGVLCEFLASGKPVIVPAGGWLSKQISKPVNQHIQSLILQSECLQNVDVTDLNWDHSNVPMAGRSISFDKDRNPFRCRFQRDDLNVQSPTGLALDFRWPWDREPGRFVEVMLCCFDPQDRLIGQDQQIATVQTGDARSLLFLRIPRGFARGELVFRNAFSDSSINISDVNVSFLDFGDRPDPPRSAIGVIVANETMLVDAVDELVNHYDHYLESAIDFSRHWSNRHDPVKTIEALMSLSRYKRQAA